MAFLRIAFFPDGTMEHWRVMAAAVGDVTIPEDRRAFAAGPTPGGWQVMQLWDSRDALDRFNRDVYRWRPASTGHTCSHMWTRSASTINTRPA